MLDALPSTRANFRIAAWWAMACVVGVTPMHLRAAEPPKSLDPRLKIELVASEPQIVTPTGLAVTPDGRVLVVESHTHFRPEGYQGPETDRILSFAAAQAVESTTRPGATAGPRAPATSAAPPATPGAKRSNQDEAARKVFYSGTKHTMNVAVAPDASVYVATRMEVFRLVDSDGDGVADQRTPVCHLETRGDYPHNGLSGFAFDAAGHVYFGMGENLGADFRLEGSDGSSFSGQEGGHVFRCRLDGSQIERVATGFWNPFHLCFDAGGQLFAVDNDPDSRPPCRLLHVVAGGNYGYKFRNGRRGTHPYTAWNGELPGTLPMVAGTGEAPAGIVCYLGTQLPAEYRHTLLVTSWGDHRIDRFSLEPQGASFRAAAVPIFVGDDDFRPVGIAAAPDGSLYVSDWVDKSYNVHGKGRLWRIAAAPNAAPGGTSSATPPPGSTASTAGATASAPATGTASGAALADADRLAALARPGLAPQVRADLLREAKSPAVWPQAWQAVDDDDPFLQQAGRRALAASGAAQCGRHWPDDAATPRRRQAILLMQRESGVPDDASCLAAAIADPDPDLRFLALEWIGEEQLGQYADAVDGALRVGPVDARLFSAYLATIERLKLGFRETNDEWSPDQYLADLIWRSSDPPVVLKRWALRSLSPTSPSITVASMSPLLADRDPVVRREAVRTIGAGTLAERGQLLLAVADEPTFDIDLRCEAVCRLVPDDPAERTALFDLVEAEDLRLRDAALRSLRGANLSDDERQRVQRSVAERPTSDTELLAFLGMGGLAARPAADDTAAWLRLLEGPADARQGERIFYQPRLTMCVRCHEHSGRGGKIGPELTVTARSLDRRRLVESILQPSREIAPLFIPWTVETQGGESFTGLWLGETMETDQLYALSTGDVRRIRVAEIARRVPQRISIMPEGLQKQLTLQELRDLLAFLQSGPAEATANE